MLHNYFKIAWRNLLKRRFYSLLTILGLSVGITFAYLVGSYVYTELQVNSSLRNADNQFIIRSEWRNPDMGVDLATLGPLGKALRDEYPNLVAGYYRYDGITVAVSRGDKHFREEVQTGDSTLLTMYGFPLLHGDVKTAMQQPNSVVITRGKALKYFGKTDVVGENLTLHNFIGGKQEYEVTAVLEDLPNNSVNHLLGNASEVFIPLSSLDGRKGAETNWNFPYMITFIQLQKGVKPADLEKPIARLLATNAPPQLRNNLRAYLTPLKSYYREANNGLVQKMIYTLSAITAFILLMAVVNFVNISVAGSASRLKEIGVRKALGSLKTQIIGQFLAESVLLAALAGLLSIGLYVLARGHFGNIIGTELPSVTQLSGWSFLVVPLIALLLGLLAGSYPAFVLSGIPSVESMKGKFKSVGENIGFRRMLLAVQFTIALFVFAAAAIVSQQVDYFFNKSLGFHKDARVTVAVPRDWTPEGLAKMEAIRNEFRRMKEVSSVSLSYEIPNGNAGVDYGVYKPGQDSSSATHTKFLATDQHFAATYGIPLLAGDFFQNSETALQTDRIVVNEALAKALGFKNPADAVGRQIRIHTFPNPLTINGVTTNFHFESMHKAIKPLAFFHVRGSNAYRFLTFHLGSDMVRSMAALEQKWHEVMPDAPFEYNFIDQTLQKLYQSEIQLKKASQLATILAVVIVLLGISGMVSLNVARRTRELGIRKVLGASEVSVVMLFLKEFLIVMLIGTLISFPSAFFVTKNWLQNYAYRITPGWFTFAAIGCGFAVLIALMVCMQTYKAARMNPVKSLGAD
ncbi:ABC transporter permease [Dyadobacter aurulentus]|uniref:ABC transporter permease n=1 Tax=Dyadobacter sp. UC 10 TaxID=2605428 RepID=UPI0011F24624|nr:ABC transporter permease [Dyadobacter sp. UC 10]KAA0989542.1 FtsX-like permease family protein [Dyadobacter sp. UC 10]